MRRTRNAVSLNGLRRFESSRLRSECFYRYTSIYSYIECCYRQTARLQYALIRKFMVYNRTMSMEHPPFQESKVEKEKILDLNIVSLNHCETIDNALSRINEAASEGKVDAVMLGEYDLRVEDTLAGLDQIKVAAQQRSTDIIIAPDNQSGKRMPWGELKKELQAHGIAVEKTDMPDDHIPETVGLYVSKTGNTYAFPKTWHLEQVHRPLHKIPNTNIGVTICGEINFIKPEDLEGVNILFNPSREGDDPYLKFRMLYRHGSQSLTKENIASILLEDPYYENLLDDEQNSPNNLNYDAKYDSHEAREHRFNRAAEEHLRSGADPNNSIYIENIETALREQNIPVVRCDGTRSTGVLNHLPNMIIRGLEYREKYTRYNLVMEK